jgi:uncharacterized membrane protein YhaH (DUF805 family)
MFTPLYSRFSQPFLPSEGKIMDSNSPYDTPKAEILNETDEYGTIKVFSAKGRIGRLRYIAYTVGISMLFYIAMMLFMGLIAAVTSTETMGMLIVPVVAVGVLAIFIINILLTIQRSHDFNSTGWLSLILLVPLLPLIFWFIPGTQGSNKYGLQPPPNKGVALALVGIIVLISIVGILAAIAIPAYQEYVARAAAAGM